MAERSAEEFHDLAEALFRFVPVAVQRRDIVYNTLRFCSMFPESCYFSIIHFPPGQNVCQPAKRNLQGSLKILWAIDMSQCCCPRPCALPLPPTGNQSTQAGLQLQKHRDRIYSYFRRHPPGTAEKKSTKLANRSNRIALMDKMEIFRRRRRRKRNSAAAIK